MKPLTYGSGEFVSADDVQSAMLRLLLDQGESVSPRGIPTVESRAIGFTLLNPRCRCILNRQRRWSLPLAIGELCWHLAGSRRASVLGYYAPTWNSYADKHGEIRGSCYGSKVFSPPTPTVWDRVRELIKADPATRRSVLYFSDPTSHLEPSCPDAACATSMQFILRRGVLDVVVVMRSNDVIWGLPYDMFLFTFLQEMMAAELGVEIGRYYHFAASLHLYEKHRSRADQILSASGPETCEFVMPPMADTSGMHGLLEIESRLRDGAQVDLSKEALGGFWRDLAEVLQLYRTSRELGWFSALRSSSSIYGPVLEPLVAGTSSALCQVVTQ